MSAPGTLSVLALLVALAALAVAVNSARQRREVDLDSPLPTDVAGLRQEVEQLRRHGVGALRAPVIVRYDAFGDMGGRMSWSLALVDDQGTGVVLTSIHGRSDARSYAKSLQDWACEQPLSPEEDKAVEAARTR